MNNNTIVSVSPQVWAQWPTLGIGYVLGEYLQNEGMQDDLMTLCTTTAEALRATFVSSDALRDDPRISQWRETYRTIGAKPNKFTPTAEALAKRVLRGDSMPFINKAVNAYLVVEMEQLTPWGGYDLDTIVGPIWLRYSPGNEPFQGLGGHDDVTQPNELVYSDDQSVLTRHWNYRDALRTQITPESRRIVLMAETLDTDDEHLWQQLSRLEGLLMTYCGGQYRSGILRQNGEQVRS